MWKAVWEDKIGIYHFLPSAISIRKAERVLPHLLWAQPQAQGRASAGIPTPSSERVRSTDLVRKTPWSQRHVVLPVWLNNDLSVSRELLLRQSDLRLLKDHTCRRTILSSHQQLYNSCLTQQSHHNILKHTTSSLGQTHKNGFTLPSSPTPHWGK